jgi:hypothetical protein
MKIIRNRLLPFLLFFKKKEVAQKVFFVRACLKMIKY